ncbi:DUF6049 family protein [Saccharothrix violaceirubra]|uniref:Glycoprotein n=1 Tax=Saccharothrix violaceirubra TaxID=413306 RepID=A0A7W7TA73_9PSEU|nr:DUF6049 family protein [Saccharothrix violaceirubra]MBB4969311.1 hypothetical protein [Saccharothrix violaceirubra]
MKRLLSALAVAGVLVVTGGPAAGAAPSEPGPLPIKPAPATQVWSTLDALTAQPGDQSQTWLRLDVEQLTPRVVTAGGPAEVTVSGKITNVGDRKISDIEFRLERGEPLKSEDEVRKALREPADAEFVQPEFTRIADELARDETREFSLTIPLRGTADTALRIDQPGIYPILANINGRPDFGGRARLAALSTLLPVVSVPGGQDAGPPATPAKITVLWPVADRPRLIRVGSDGQSLLTDDQLASSFAPGGRLYGLLKAYESAVTGPLAPAMCLAVDPDLLRTAIAMAGGYQVRGLGEGKGRTDADLWLRALRAAVAGRCVIALPDADADLVALTRAGLGDLTGLALGGGELVREALQVQPLPDLVWPEDGVVDEQTFTDLTTRGVRRLVLDQSAVGDAPGTNPVRLGEQGGGDAAAPTTAVRIDAMVSDALRGTAQTFGGDRPTPVSVQNALAALAYRTGFQGDGRNLVIAPPRRWSAPTGEITTFLDVTENLVASGFATPTGLATVLDGPAPEQIATLGYPVDAGVREVSPTITAAVGDSYREVVGMADAMRQVDAADTPVADLVDPLRLDLLRVVSGAWRGDESGARATLVSGMAEVDALRGQVTVTEPNSPILLGSGDSPIPVTIRNNLGVRVVVRIVLEDAPGIRAKEFPDQVLPAHGERFISVPVEVLRSGRFSLHLRLTTPGGVELGERARLEVSSSAYGTITLVITCLAAGLLVLLVSRRIYRRVRAVRAAAVLVPDDAEGVTPEKSSAS